MEALVPWLTALEEMKITQTSMSMDISPRVSVTGDVVADDVHLAPANVWPSQQDFQKKQ